MIATVPHKFGLAAHCATLTDRARFLGSVNVARRNPDGTWHGDQVDGADSSPPPSAGGVPEGARRCRSAPAARGPRSRWPCWRPESPSWRCTTPTPARSRRLGPTAARALRRPRQRRIDRIPTGFDLVAHATPMGMRAGDPYPVDVTRLDAGTVVADVITKPAVPPLIEAARKIGCRTSTGVDMYAAVGDRIVDFLVAEGLPGRGRPEE